MAVHSELRPGLSAKRQDEEAGTEQDDAGDGDSKETVRGEFITHCRHPMRAAWRPQLAAARWYLRISTNRARQYSRYIKLMSIYMTDPH